MLCPLIVGPCYCYLLTISSLAPARKEAELLLDPALLPSDWSAETVTGIIDIYVETETTGRSY